MADILVFGAHPDDAEFGMGASIVKFIKEGKSVVICVLTKGQSGTYGTVDEREKEMKAAADKSGAKLHVLDMVDCNVFDNYENRIKIAQVIRGHRPKVIFTPYHTNNANHKDGLAHPDHITTGILAKNAARYARFKGLKDLGGEPWVTDRIIYYMVPQNIRPNLINDVSCCMQDWEEIAKLHKSQMMLREGKVLEMLRTYRQFTGRLIGVEYAEAFFMEEPLNLDLDQLIGKGSTQTQGH